MYGESKNWLSSQLLRVNVQSVKSKVLKIAQHFLWLTFKKTNHTYFKMTCTLLLSFPLVSRFFTFTVSSPSEYLDLKPIQKCFESQSVGFWQQHTSRLKSGTLLYHLPVTSLTDAPTLEVKTFDLPVNQLLIHHFSIARIKVNEIWISPLLLNERHSARSWGLVLAPETSWQGWGRP